MGFCELNNQLTRPMNESFPMRRTIVEQKNATNTGGACGVADGSQDDSALICPD